MVLAVEGGDFAGDYGDERVKELENVRRGRFTVRCINEPRRGECTTNWGAL